MFSLERFPTSDGPIRAMGIDLGTTNSTVAEAIWDPGQPDELQIKCCEIEQRTLQGIYTHTIVPSVVAIWQGEALVGEGAKRLRTELVQHQLVERRSVFAETKNEIGTSRVYPGAPANYDTPRAIATHVLRFLKAGALEANGVADPVVVTVPASFQAAQRADTRSAAEGAGISAVSLLDEPVAAFLDYVHSDENVLAQMGREARRLLVFDFGGGTCDVAILQVEAAASGSLAIAPLSVSRYHRLGGGDIDAAILHEVLIPQLIEENELDPQDLGFAAKKNVIGPSLIGIAEALKVGLCDQISRLMAFGKYESADKASIVKTQPGVHLVQVDDKELRLTAPKLTAERFEELLEPFLDTDLLFARSTEYRLTCSVFAPIEDALDRSDLSHSDVDLVLLVGGSTRIPQLVAALKRYLPEARLLRFDDRERQQTSIARGAAIQALHVAATGQGLVTPVAGDRIALRTAVGTEELVARGAALPFPPIGHKSLRLAAPRSSEHEQVEVRVEVVGGEEERLLLSKIWPLQAPVTKGERLDLTYTLDADQVLNFRLSRFEQARSTPFEGVIESPLTNVVNPNRLEQEIEQIETAIRSSSLEPSERDRKVNELVRKYDEAGHVEKAIEFAKRLLQRENRPNPYLLNRLGLLYEKVHDFARSERMFRESAKSGSWQGALFNLGLQLQKKNKLQEALAAVRQAIAKEDEPPYGILEAQLLDDLGEKEGRDAVLARTLPSFGPLHTLDDWELGWLKVGCRLAGDEARVAEAEAERRRRQRDKADPEQSGELPQLAEETR